MSVMTPPCTSSPMVRSLACIPSSMILPCLPCRSMHHSRCIRCMTLSVAYGVRQSKAWAYPSQGQGVHGDVIERLKGLSTHTLTRVDVAVRHAYLAGHKVSHDRHDTHIASSLGHEDHIVVVDEAGRDGVHVDSCVCVSLSCDT